MEITLSLFPKFYRHMEMDKLAETVKKVGLDACNAVVRENFWITPEGLRDELPAFIKTMEKHEVKVPFCTAGFEFKSIIEDADSLRILADNGIKDFRPAYFKESGRVNPGYDLREARSTLETIAPICERHGVRMVYQLHHRTLVASPSAAWHIVRDLPPEAVGVMLDPGNQAFEGFENWGRSVRLLGKHTAAVGVKDSAPFRDQEQADTYSKGWKRDWAPVYEGTTNWHELVRALKHVDFRGTFIFMPFYDADHRDRITEKLTKEVQYIRKILSEVESA